MQLFIFSERLGGKSCHFTIVVILWSFQFYDNWVIIFRSTCSPKKAVSINQLFMEDPCANISLRDATRLEIKRGSFPNRPCDQCATWSLAINFKTLRIMRHSKFRFPAPSSNKNTKSWVLWNCARATHLSHPFHVGPHVSHRAPAAHGKREGERSSSTTINFTARRPDVIYDHPRFIPEGPPSSGLVAKLTLWPTP